MDDLREVLDLAIVFTQPPPSSPPELLAHVVVQCDALGLSHTGEVFTDPLTRYEREDLLWYLEEYWQWPYLVFAERGKRVEALLGDVGRRFYHALFGSREAENIIQVWQQHVNVQHHRISIVSEIPSVLRLPWELLADPQGFLVLHADPPISLVRRLPTQDEQVSLTTPIQLPLRILFVTARPEEAGFVDPRNISRELVDALQRQTEAGSIELEFLRPPTFAALNARLKDTEHPIHVLHFDGHGGLGGKEQQGILLFETEAGNPSPVEANNLAKVLKNSGVRLAVLTACQSATDTKDDTLSSVSTQLINNGMDAVIAMSSSILVTSAALYVEAFYHALAEGLPVSSAQEQARQVLHKDPHRHLFRRHQDKEAAPVTLADWWVPHFYQQRPLTLHTTRVLRTHSQQQTSAPARFNDAMPPEPRYRFSGRARELLQIERALLRKQLVVISGFGGGGKTALVREAADWLTRTGMYTSACFVSFEHGGDASLLLSELGTFLGINDGNYMPNDSDAALARLKFALQVRPTLIVADNLESILPNGEIALELADRSQLWGILRKLAALSAGVLLTTRDTTFSDDQFAPGAHVAHLPLCGLAPQDAYTLATRLLEDLGIDRVCAPYVELRDLLLTLDHHPLAIQLVLPILHATTLSTICTDFATLLPTFADEHTEGRNRSLLASLEYSLHRLSAAQHDLLPRLTIFEGGASEANLLEITQIPEQEWAELRLALEKTALLTSEAVETPFLQFHPVLIPYLRSALLVDDAVMRERYIHHYEAVAQTLYFKDDQDPKAARAQIRTELPNLRRAMDLLLSSGAVEQAAAMADCITRFLKEFGRRRETMALRERIHVVVQQQDVSHTGQLTYAIWLDEKGQGDDMLEEGNQRAAFEHFNRLLARIQVQPTDARFGPDSYEHGLTLHCIANCLQYSQKPVQAESYLRTSLSVMEALVIQKPEEKAYSRELGGVLKSLADVLMDQGKYAQAREGYEQALEIDIQLKIPRGQAVKKAQLGTLALREGNYPEARKNYQNALQEFQKLNLPAMEANVYLQLGGVAEEQQEWAQAEYYYRESLTLREFLGDTAGVATTCSNLGILAKNAGRFAEAEGWYRRAIDLDKQTHPGSPHAQILNNLADLLVSEMEAGQGTPQHLTEAKQLAEQALCIKETLDASADIWRPLNVLTRIAEREGRVEEARAYRRRSQEAFAAFAGNRYLIDQQKWALIAAIVAATQADLAMREQVEAALPQLEEVGWRIADAIRRILAGEREWHPLVEEVDDNSALLILRVLETLAALERTLAALAPEQQRIWTMLQTLRGLAKEGEYAGGDFFIAQQINDRTIVLIEMLVKQGPENHSVLELQSKQLADIGDVLLYQQGRYAEAKAAHEQALQIGEQIRNLRIQAVSRGQLGAIALQQGEYEEAQQCYEKALATFQALDEPAMEAAAWNQLGTVALLLQQFKEAKGWYQRALELSRQTDATSGTYAGHLSNVADTLVREVEAGRAQDASAQLVEAQRYMEQALPIDERLNSSNLLRVYGILARIAKLQGRIEEAQDYRRRERETYAAFAGHRSRIDQRFGSLLPALAAAQVDLEVRAQVEEILPQVEATGWHISEALHHIWVGEQDWHVLTEGLGNDSALLVLRILETLAASTNEAAHPPEKQGPETPQ